MKRFLLAALVTLVSFTSAEEKPNVLFIAIDDLNAMIGALGGTPKALTPNIDRLAKRGILFSRAYCAAPACNPSRTAVLTGMRPTTSGVYFNNQDWRESSRLKDIVTLPEHFRNHGYQVMGGGKLYHAASLSEKGHTGLLDGDSWDVYFPSKNQQLEKEALPEKIPMNGSKEYYKGFFDWAALDIADDEMGDAKVVSWASKQLSRVHDKPLFLGVGIYRPHIPFYTPKPYFDLYPEDELVLPGIVEGDLDDIPKAGQAMARRDWHQWVEENNQWKSFVRAYFASVSFADAMVGRLVDALDSGPNAGNTVVVLWSDHGYHLGHKEHWEKFALWEQTTRVPLIFSAPGIEGGSVCHHPASLLDVYPTLAALTNTGVEPQWDGESLVPFLKDPGAESNRAVVITQGPGNHAVRSNSWRYIRYADNTEELYDHENDPDEFTNLAALPGFEPVIREHAVHLPESEAELDPAARGKRKK